MNLSSAASRYIYLFICALASGDAFAVTLGGPRGAAFLGQPLQLVVPVQFNPEDDSSAACFQAEVHYGELRQDTQSVTVNVDRAEASPAANIRIRSANKVDEPVVTVTLRAVCNQKISRRYVVLADLPSEPVTSFQAVTRGELAPIVPEPNIPNATTLPLAGMSASVTTPIAEQARSTVKTNQPKKRVKQAEKSSSRVTKERPSRPEKGNASEQDVAKKSRLKLSTWELGNDTDPVLKSTDSMLFLEPLENLQKRAEAIAAWRALNKTTEEVVQQEVRVQNVEGDLKSLKDVNSRDQQSLAELSARLQNAQEERYANPLVFALVGLLVLLVAVVVFLLIRQRDTVRVAGPWWRGARSETDDIDGITSGYQASELRAEKIGVAKGRAIPTQASQAASGANAMAEKPPVEVDFLLGDSEVDPLEAVDTLAPETISPGLPSIQSPQKTNEAVEHKEFEPSVTGAMRAINSNEMLDVRHQADFFMTLGQHEAAIAVLCESMAHSELVNPLVYLDLLKIFHTLSRKAEYDRYREEFSQEFSVNVPEYSGFNQTGKSLEAYAEILGRIVDSWPKDSCIEFIGNCLVRNSVIGTDDDFDVEAFRELVMLYAIAKRLNASTESSPEPFTALRRFKRVSSGLELPMIPGSLAPELEIAGVDLELDLDIEPEGNLIDFDVSGLSTTEDTSKIGSSNT